MGVVLSIASHNALSLALSSLCRVSVLAPSTALLMTVLASAEFQSDMSLVLRTYYSKNTTLHFFWPSVEEPHLSINSNSGV
ncbi:hypothetical protein BKA67DRAFT_558487 [Truncatella angustata]|uniref:Secreted protein n=1 Tax=Truncatella angustata TaxID=152316 RepID=A0A9P8UUT7_9PEZI|nr:uncharacterized protein BKA67DRAFT_558487 [Truncatella angustata]KAH6658591.1 hypothetical protein BKA67DRAFT_558487 [Truncatella angustata]